MADVSVNNADTDLSGKTLVTAENAYAITGLHTYNRSPSAPFAVQAGSAKVTNLDADLLDGLSVQSILDKAQWTVATITTTGTANNFAPGFTGNQPLLVICANASALTITGIAGGAAGQKVLLLGSNAQVNLAHNNGSSAAGNRLQNHITVGNTVIMSKGWALYQHNGTDWSLIGHSQGGWVAEPFSAGNFVPNAGTWTVEAGDVSVNRWYVNGKVLTWELMLATTTLGTTPAACRITLPNGFNQNVTTSQPYRLSDNGGAFFWSVVIHNNASFSELYPTAAGTGAFANATNTTAMQCVMTHELL